MEYLTRRRVAGLALRSLKYAARERPRVRISTGAPAPLISVIIATYNWSNVLKLAIQSVLWQSEQNFEVLVVGDGCTDDSEQVVRSFGDVRVHWHNLPVNTGHQSAANNKGIELAQGRYISYLGHDDIWHPDHLRTMLSAMEGARAGFATSLLEMIGPKETNFRVVIGFYPSGGFDGNGSVPPSGMMHSRDAISKAGGWKDYRTISRNPDVDLLYRFFEAGLKSVSTGELTVFKFNSALRKNSYIEKPCHEQMAYCERIENNRWFMLQEALGIARIHLRKLPMRSVEIPAPPAPHTPGWYVTQYRKLRGLE